MAEITIKFDKNELYYDAKECSARDFAAVANASIHHLEVEFKEKGENISVYIAGMKKSLAALEAKTTFSS